MWLMSAIKLGVEPNPTLKLRTQSTMGATLQWFRLEPQLSESFT